MKRLATRSSWPRKNGQGAGVREHMYHEGFGGYDPCSSKLLYLCGSRLATPSKCMLKWSIMNINGQPEILGGITITKDGLVLTAGPTAGMWTGGSNDSGNMQMDCGESGHYFGDWKITN